VSNLFEQLQATLGNAYRLERELGGGGMSRVFVAQEVALGRNVVIKVLLPELAAGVSVDRFRREIQFAAQLQHPHIVPLLSAGESNGLPFFTMPFISGETLAVKLARTGELPVNETVRILRDVASALAYAHGEGIMHRDVKPGNVLISGGVAVVTDFGVAKALSVSADSSATHLTSLGVALGTPAYMAPEQASGDPQVDHRADIYALGIMTYEMLAGRTPFWGRATSAVLAAHVVEEPEPIDKLRPGMPAMLATLVMQCLAKRAADRPQSAGEVMHVLDAISTPTGGTASTTVVVTPPKTGGLRVGRRPSLMLSGAAAVLLVAGAVLWGRREVRDSATAQRVAAQMERASRVRDSIASRSDASLREESRVPEPEPAPVPAPAPAAPVESPRPKSAPRPKGPGTAVTPKPAAAHPRDTAPAQRRATETPVQPESIAQAPHAEPAPIPQPVPAQTTAMDSVVTRSPPRPPAPQPAAPAPPQPAPDPAPEIRSVLAAYGTAVESQNVDNIRRLYPGMTAGQQRSWEQFFQTVRDVKAQLSVSGLDVANGAAEAQMTGTYTYLNSSTRETERRPVAFHVSLRREPAGWRITQVR
jgi:serine/threonine-protein kinase